MRKVAEIEKMKGLISNHIVENGRVIANHGARIWGTRGSYSVLAKRELKRRATRARRRFKNEREALINNGLPAVAICI